MNAKKILIAVLLNVFIQFILFFILFSIIFQNITIASIISIFLSMSLTLIQVYFANTIMLKNIHGHASTLNKAVQLQEKLNSICAEYDITTPQLYIITNKNINSISICKNKNISYICLTEGALVYLNTEELEYLLRYEVNKIFNNETAFNTLIMSTLGFLLATSDIFFKSINKSIRKRGRPSESIMRIILTGIFNLFSPLIMNIIHKFIPKYYDIQNDILTNTQVRTNTYCLNILRKSIETNKYDEDAAFASSNMFFVNTLTGNKMFNKINHHTNINDRIEYIQKN